MSEASNITADLPAVTTSLGLSTETQAFTAITDTQSKDGAGTYYCGTFTEQTVNGGGNGKPCVMGIICTITLPASAGNLYLHADRITTTQSRCRVLPTVSPEQLAKKWNIVPPFLPGHCSKSLLRYIHNSNAYDLELQAIVSALSFFRYILHGRYFILRTDHSALLTLTSKKQPIGRIALQLDMLAVYDFTIEHLPGTQNATADALSRNFTNTVKISTVIDVQSDFHPETWWDDLLGDVYFAPIVMSLDPFVTANARNQHTKDQIEKRLPELKQRPDFLRRFSLEGKCLIYDKDVQLDGQGWICVPETKTKEILKKVHDDELHGGHFGIYNTFLKATTISY